MELCEIKSYDSNSPNLYFFLKKDKYQNLIKYQKGKYQSFFNENFKSIFINNISENQILIFILISPDVDIEAIKNYISSINQNNEDSINISKTPDNE